VVASRVVEVYRTAIEATGGIVTDETVDPVG
jgi:hypothetical protein